MWVWEDSRWKDCRETNLPQTLRDSLGEPSSGVGASDRNLTFFVFPQMKTGEIITFGLFDYESFLFALGSQCYLETSQNKGKGDGC